MKYFVSLPPQPKPQWQNYILKIPYLFVVLFFKDKKCPTMSLHSRIQDSCFSIPNKCRLWNITGQIHKLFYIYKTISVSPKGIKPIKPKKQTVKQYFKENKDCMFQYSFMSHARVEGYNWLANRLKVQVFNYAYNTRYKTECLPSDLSVMKNMSEFY